jgi:hypothetical protein
MNLQENINRIKEVMGLLKEYEEQQPDIKSSIQNGFIFIDSISQVPKVGVPMDKEEFKRDGTSALSWDNIVIVRATDESPTINKGYMVMHTSRALKTMGWNDDFMKNLRKRWEEKYSDEPWDEFVKEYKDIVGKRWTKHFTLNHMVEDNSGGIWKDLSLIYLMPGKEMASLNGSPSSLHSIDTWYSKSVVIPRNTVVLYTPKAKNKIEKMSIQFNSELEGKHLKYPVYFLEINSKDEVNQVINAMGYSTIVGGSHYSHEEGVDDEFRDFGDKEGIAQLGLHANTFWSRMEENGMFGVSVHNLFENLNYLLESIKSPEKVDEWYGNHRRIISTYWDSVFTKDIEKIKSKKNYETLIENLKYIKNNLHKYDKIKNFKKDIFKSIEKNNVMSVLKTFFWKENGYNSLEDFINDVMPV